jgi:hypothetical protein
MTQPPAADTRFVRSHVSEKTDSYAFGVVLLELVMGSTPMDAIRVMCERPEWCVVAVAAAVLAQLRSKRALLTSTWSAPLALAGGRTQVRWRTRARPRGSRMARRR